MPTVRITGGVGAGVTGPWYVNVHRAVHPSASLRASAALSGAIRFLIIQKPRSKFLSLEITPGHFMKRSSRHILIC